MASRPPWEDQGDWPRSLYQRDLDSISREIRDIMLDNATQAYSKPHYKTKTLAAIPTAYLISFIGGPWNGEQKYFDRVKHLNGEVLRDNQILRFAVQAPIPLNIKDISDSIFETTTYRFILIPTNETPFSDVPCVVGIYQE